MNLNDFLLYKKAEEFMKKNKKTNYVFQRYEERAIRRAKRNIGKFRQRRNDEQDDVMTISFQIVATIPDNITDEEYDETSFNTIDTLYNVADVLEVEAQNGVLVPEVENVSLSVNQDSSFTYDYPGPNCDPGFAVSWESMSCVPCVAGSYYDDVMAQCTICPIGTYQDSDWQTQCLQCPPNTTTLEEGAKNATECLTLCIAGTYSDTGVEPCTLCELGSFQPKVGTKDCAQCPFHHSTLMMGSTSLEQCLAFCSPGYYSSTGFEPCKPCPVRYYQSNSGQQSCDVCPRIKTTVGTGTINMTQCNVTAECESNDCMNGATCLPLIQGPICLCADGFNGTFCEENIDDCTERSCANAGTCEDGIDTYTCVCEDGFDGPDCSIDINECASEPCLNGAVCIDLIGDFMCECLEGFEGKTCQNVTNPCESNPCQNEGNCENRITSFHCTCLSGTTGDVCEIDIDECQSEPCLNNGICSDGRDTYECACTPGYSGDQCEMEVSLCNPNPCVNGGTCIQQADEYMCVCLSGKAGDFCERGATPCDKGPCFNGGVCQDSSQVIDGQEMNYTCDCSSTGFTGIHCEEEIDECLSNPCSNGGNCKNLVNGFGCECSSLFTGETCEQILNPCDKISCLNNGTCAVDGLSARCVCPVGYEGSRCDTMWKACQDEFCQNGGYCAPPGSSQFCICIPGFNGITCENNIDECESEPCQNAGTCIDSVGEYNCTCQPGYNGVNCEININDCSEEKCINGACIDKVNDFLCQCYDGFEGRGCDYDIDDCVHNSCVNGICKDGNETYTCECSSGFGGRYCEIEADECASDPCVHATECKDLLDNYECICETGWTGRRCELNINACNQESCFNGGICQDNHTGFTCLCPPGFEGELCEKYYDECVSSPCLHGSCIDEVNGYKCICPACREGRRCQIQTCETSFCLSNPCSNGGTCTVDEGEDGYSCFCIDGFVGEYCEINEDDCLHNDCPQTATCKDEVNGFSCICNTGFDGEDCDVIIDPCVAFPCENGGTCLIGEDSDSRCLCPLGYEGIYCERNIDDCMPNPCLHNGVCIDGLSNFTCECTIGYSGEICEEDIDLCLNNLCDYFGTKNCHDGFESYTCECRRGFLGQYCDTVSSTNFEVVFTNLDPNQFIVMRGVPQEEVESFTLALWLRTTSETSVILTHGSEDVHQRILSSLIIESPRSLTVVIQGFALNSGVSINDDMWHHVALTFDHTTSLSHLFVDGEIVTAKSVPVLVKVLPDNGVFSLGTTDTTEYGNQFAGRISGLNVWDEVFSPNTIMQQATSCFANVPGNVIGMDDILDGTMGDVWLNEPSTCDAVNDCRSSPCENGGVCIDGYHEFTCLCPDGLGGSKCEVNFDDCFVNACENNGTCVDGLNTFSCKCLEGFTGTLCGLAVVNGGWSEWSSWTPCTKSCGTGIQRRTRECNNPEPENGGSSCGTQTSENRACNIKPCPACKKFVRPRRGYQKCRTATSGDISCTAHCYRGYAFSTQPRQEYKCGKSTNYIWTHESKSNPHLRVPGCTKLTKPIAVQAHVGTTYNSLQCSSMNKVHINEVNDRITQTFSAVSQREGCVRTKECQLVNLQTRGCFPPVTKRTVTLTRGRRNANNVTVLMTFLQSVNVSGDNFTSSNDVYMVRESVEESKTNLYNLSASIKDDIEGGSFRISAEGQLYDTVYEDGDQDIVCSEGQMQSDNEVLCIPCAPGTFWIDENCQPCEEGFFQPDEGQTSCISCPEGVVSQVIGAVSVDECDVEDSYGPEE